MTSEKKRILDNGGTGLRVILFLALLISVASLSSIVSYSAPQLDTLTTNNAFWSVNGLSISHTTGSGQNRYLMVVLTFNNKNAQTVKSVSYKGFSLTQVGEIASVNDVRMEFWGRVAPPSGTYPLNVTFSGKVDHAIIVNALSFTGVDQTTPLGTFKSSYNQAGTVAPSISVSSSTNDLVLGASACQTCTTLEAASGQTEIWNSKTGTVNSAYYVSEGSTKPGASSVSFSWTQGSKDHWVTGGVPLRPSAASPPPPPPPPDTTPPSTPTNLKATVLSSSQISLSWTQSLDAESGISYYEIYRNGGKIGQSSSTSYSDSGLNPSTTYTYEVSATSTALLKSGKASVSGTTLSDGDTTPLQDTTSPSAPAGLSATAVSSSRISLSWGASSDPESGVLIYEVYRDGAKIGQTSSAYYTDDGLKEGTYYTYGILAVNGVGLKSSKSLSSATTDFTTTLENIPGDVDGDGIVGSNDAIVIVRDFGKTSGFDPRADINKDHVINIFDLTIIGVNWLRTY